MERTGNAVKPQTGTRVACPMCGTGDTLPEGKVKEYYFQTCPRCELVWSPEITPEYLSKLYAEGFHGPQDGAPKKGWCRDIRFLDSAFELLPNDQPLKILDFGTGQNAVPDELRKQGHRVIGVNIAPPVRPHPDRLTGNILDFKLEPNQFDLVYSFQVFEHLPQPRQILEELLRLTKPGGLLLIHTDTETADRENSGFKGWWYVAPPDHCTFYRNRTFEIFLRNTTNELVRKAPTSVVIRKISA